MNKDEFKHREKIPLYGSVLMVIGCILLLGVFPCIPVMFWVHYNNYYVKAYESNNEVLMKTYQKCLKLAKIAIIVVTILSIIIEAIFITYIALDFIEYLEGLQNECIPCKKGV